MKKRILLLAVAVCSVAQMFALKSAAYSYRYELTDRSYDSVTMQFFHSNYGKVVQDRMDKLAVNFARQIVQGDAVNNWSQTDKNNLEQVALKFCTGRYNNALDHYGSQTYDTRDFMISTVKRKLIQSSAFRNFVFSVGCDYLVRCCKEYPKDFRKTIINEIKDLQAFAAVMDNGQYEIADVMSSYGISKEVYVNGKQVNMWQFGRNRCWLLRRYLLDGISVSEIRSKLNTLLAKVQAADNSANPDVMFAVLINGNLQLTISTEGTYLESANSSKRMALNHTGGMWPVSIRRVGNNYAILWRSWMSSYRTIVDDRLNILRDSRPR